MGGRLDCGFPWKSILQIKEPKKSVDFGQLSALVKILTVNNRRKNTLKKKKSLVLSVKLMVRRGTILNCIFLLVRNFGDLSFLFFFSLSLSLSLYIYIYIWFRFVMYKITFQNRFCIRRLWKCLRFGESVLVDIKLA